MEKEQSGRFREKYINQVEEVLFEETKLWEGKTYQIGHTSRYVKAAKLCEDNLSNRQIKGRLTKFLTEDILLME